MLYADDYGNALAHVISGQLVHIFEQIATFCISVNTPCQCTSEPGQVSSSVSVADDVRVTLNGFIVGVRPLHGQLDVNFATFGFPHAFDVDYIGVNWVAPFVQLLDKFRYPSIILMFHNFRRISSLINDCDFQPCIEECCLSQSSVEDVVIKLGNSSENVQIGFECNRSPRSCATSNFS